MNHGVDEATQDADEATWIMKATQEKKKSYLFITNNSTTKKIERQIQ